jgi:oxygen-independent coproporphyrinogen III oxidase
MLDVDRFAGHASCYVHTPFCARVCPYCDFAVVEGRDDMVDRYFDALCAEIAMSPGWRPLDAVYFGGGTPSHVSPSLLGRVIGALRSLHGIAGPSEMSVEANPEDITVEKAHGLREAGFNRISFGAQSFDPVILAALGRRHEGSHIAAAVGRARQAGFDNISIDLIYGTPGETTASWQQTLLSAIDLGVDHVSCYALTVEKGTPLGRAVSAGATAPDPDTQADRYEHARETLAAAGYRQYEVSNWSRPGRECQYNLTVWAQGQYLAYGNGAHGHIDWHRSRNLRRLDAYLEAVERGARPLAGSDAIEGWDREIDRLFVGLRRTAGVSLGPGTDALLDDEEGRRLAGAGVVGRAGGRLVVLRPLLTDMVHRAVLSLEAPRITWGTR